MPLSVPASSENDAAGTEEISWVFDDYGLLDETEQAQLDQELGIFMRSMVMMPYF